VVWFDPLRARDGMALGALQPPTEGPADTVVPRWAVFDFAEVPGAVVGFLRDGARGELAALSLVLATPLAEAGAWHLYGLTGADGDGPGAVRLGLETIRAAMDLLRADRATLVLPWTSAVLGALPGLGVVEVLAARTPLHADGPAATVLLYSPGTPAPRAGGSAAFEIAADRGRAGGAIDCVQAAIEGGRRFVLERAGPAIREGFGDRLLVREVSP
jgi:hypothetical protein